MKNFLFLLFCICVTFNSCSRLSPTEKKLREGLNTSLNIEMFDTVHHGNLILSFDELRSEYNYISMIYLRNGCHSCYPRFITWQQKMESIGIPDNYTVLFVIKGNSYSEFMSNVLDINYVDDKFYTVMDSETKFVEKNKNIPRWIIDSSILIDSENKIKMVGAPFATPEMTELPFKSLLFFFIKFFKSSFIFFA